MNEIYKSNPELMEIENELHGLKSGIKPRSSTEAKESNRKYPPTDFFGGVRLSKTGTYSNIPGNPERLKRTARRCANNPTYKDSLVMTKNGQTRQITHNETYYTENDVDSHGKLKFPVKNIECKLIEVLNEDRERQGLKRLPKNQKLRDRAEDGTIRDMNGYIIVAADRRNFPRGTLIMTTLGPGRVYDVGSKVNKNHIDVFTSWPV